MKRGAVGHPKTVALAIQLGIRKAEAVGLLEACWHFASQYTPRGDIGRYGDEVIEQYALWEGGSGEFVKAMVEVGYFEKNEEHRLVVHDWRDHCDNTVQKYLAEHGMTFFDGGSPWSRRQLRRGEQPSSNLVTTGSSNPVVTELSSPSLSLSLSLAKPIKPSPPTPSIEGGDVGGTGKVDGKAGGGGGNGGGVPRGTVALKYDESWKLEPWPGEKRFVALYNEASPKEWPPVNTLSNGMRERIRSYLRQFPDFVWWVEMFRQARESSFCRRYRDGGMGFILRKGHSDGIENCAKIHDGKFIGDGMEAAR